jgi:hypothetical protein
MKIHPDPSDEFANLAKTRYQRYVLYRLESSAAASPLKYLAIGILLVALISTPVTKAGMTDFGWPSVGMTFIALLSIGEIYFSRAVLGILRGRCLQEEKTDQQDAPSDGGQRPSLNSGFLPRRG